MNSDLQFEDRASSSRSKHEGESSSSLCDRLSRTRDFSQRQLPTDHDYAVPTREYQIDQSSLKHAPTAAGPVLERRNKQRQQQKQPHKCAAVDGVTPYQGIPTQAGLVTGHDFLACPERSRRVPQMRQERVRALAPEGRLAWPLDLIRASL